MSAFNKKYLPTLYYTLFTILNRCLTSKNSRVDTITHPMALLFQGVVEDRHYDYAQLILSDLVEMVTMTTKKKKTVTYVRLFPKIIHSAMMWNLEIPRRINHQIVDWYHMHFIRYSTEVFELERPLIHVVLNYVDQQAPSVIDRDAQNRVFTRFWVGSNPVPVLESDKKPGSCHTRVGSYPVLTEIYGNRYTRLG